MRRKLINYEAFERIQKDSLSVAEHELLEAQDVLAKALGQDNLKLECFGKDTCVFETLDGTYLHANYKLDRQHLTLENIEELVIEESSAKKKSRSMIAEMVDAILAKEDVRANGIFSEFMSLPTLRKTLTEGNKPGVKSGTKKDKGVARLAGISRSKNRKNDASRLKRQKKTLDSVASPNQGNERAERGSLGLGGTKNPRYNELVAKKYKQEGRKRKKFKDGKVVIEWANLVENVFDYVDFQAIGPVLKESVTKTDNSGNVIALRIPTQKLRNEGKILSTDWKVLKTDLKVVREGAFSLAEDANFCKAIFDVKRQNNLSDDESLQEAIETVIAKWPAVLYLTQEELSSVVSEALHAMGVSNYDDQQCAFIAEGILRTAHHVLSDKVEKILRLAGASVTTESEDKYLDFANAVTEFYPSLDEQFALETKVFSDLAEVLEEVGNLAYEAGDQATLHTVKGYYDDLNAIVSGNAEADIDLAEEVAEWLGAFIETNLGTTSWDVSSKTTPTVNGDHPDMAKKARQSYSPSADLGGDVDWQTQTTEPAFTGPQWTGVGGKEVWPDLKNPYIPAPFGDYTMKGETGVDKDATGQFGATWQSGDTWPNLKNPYIPAAITGYKMKNGPETDLVIDK
jgi:hypothetical protein